MRIVKADDDALECQGLPNAIGGMLFRGAATHYSTLA